MGWLGFMWGCWLGFFLGLGLGFLEVIARPWCLRRNMFHKHLLVLVWVGVAWGFFALGFTADFFILGFEE